VKRVTTTREYEAGELARETVEDEDLAPEPTPAAAAGCSGCCRRCCWRWPYVWTQPQSTPLKVWSDTISAGGAAPAAPTYLVNTPAA
jgi:hypothetical protein